MDLKMIILLLLLVACCSLAKDLEAPHHSTRLCGMCSDIEHPSKCTTLERCGLDEICYTREYTDYNSNKRYRMGCQNRAVCAVYDNARHLFILGRRAAHTTIPPIPQFCFDCCDTDECNDKLCDVRHRG